MSRKALEYLTVGDVEGTPFASVDAPEKGMPRGETNLSTRVAFTITVLCAVCHVNPVLGSDT